MTTSFMRLNAVSILSIAIGLTTSGAAFAAKSKSNDAVKLKQSIENAKSACAKDINTLCSDVNPGEGRVLDCLSSKSDQLSQGCSASRNEMKAAASKVVDKATVTFRKDCGSDVQKFCADVPAGQGRLLDCLSKHDDSLSSSCKDFQAKLSEQIGDLWKS